MTHSHTQNTLAIVTAFPPGSGSLNEYGLHMVKALVKRSDVDKITIIADVLPDPLDELDLGPKVEVHRIWSFNSVCSGFKILRALKKCGADSVLYNLQTASFGDREIPAALGLLTPMITQKCGIPSGVILHNLIDAVDLSKTQIGTNVIRQKIVQKAGEAITRLLLKTGYVTVTLDSFADILQTKYNSQNAFMVPHGTFERESSCDLPNLSERPNRIVTMGKFGTYKKLDRMIKAIQSINTSNPNSPVELVIGGSNHPATPGYLESLEALYAADTNIKFHGYVAEEEVENFFTSARLAIFDYDSTTGSSGVLHQAAIYRTPAAYPLMGDFVDVTEREGIRGFHFTPLDVVDLQKTISKALNFEIIAQDIADSNLNVSQSVTLQTVMAVHLRLLQRLKSGRLLRVRTEDSRRLHLTLPMLSPSQSQ